MWVDPRKRQPGRKNLERQLSQRRQMISQERGQRMALIQPLLQEQMRQRGAMERQELSGRQQLAVGRQQSGLEFKTQVAGAQFQKALENPLYAGEAIAALKATGYYEPEEMKDISSRFTAEALPRLEAQLPQLMRGAGRDFATSPEFRQWTGAYFGLAKEAGIPPAHFADTVAETFKREIGEGLVRGIGRLGKGWLPEAFEDVPSRQEQVWDDMYNMADRALRTEQ